MLPVDLQKVIADFREEERKKKEKWEVERTQQREESDPEFKFSRRVLPHLRPASVADYLEWLRGYIENGGKPTHSYDYSHNQAWKWYVATTDIPCVPLCGSSAVNIIVPCGVSAEQKDWGHCNLFFMEGYKAVGVVPIFSDTNF